MDILVKVCCSYDVLGKHYERHWFSVDLNSKENIYENISLSFIVLNRSQHLGISLSYHFVATVFGVNHKIFLFSTWVSLWYPFLPACLQPVCIIYYPIEKTKPVFSLLQMPSAFLSHSPLKIYYINSHFVQLYYLQAIIRLLQLERGKIFAMAHSSWKKNLF